MKPNKYLEELMKKMDVAMKDYKEPEINLDNLMEAAFQATLAFTKLAFIRSKALKLDNEELKTVLGETEYFLETIQKKTHDIEREIYMRSVLEPIVEQMHSKERTVN